MPSGSPRKRRLGKLHSIIYGNSGGNDFLTSEAYLQRSASVRQDVLDYIASGGVSYTVGIHKISNDKLFHLDAYDLGTVTLSGSDNISSWSDKEGGKTVSFVGNPVTSYPQKQVVINRNVPSFTVLNTVSSSFKYTNADNLFFKSGTTHQARSYFGVVRAEANDNMGAFLHTGQNWGYSIAIDEVATNRRLYLLLHESGSNSCLISNTITGATVASGSQYVFGVTYNGGPVLTSASWGFYNSKASGSIPVIQNFSLTSASVGDAFYIGSIAASGSTQKNMSGSVHEMLIYSGALSNTDALTVMNALASKWGATLS